MELVWQLETSRTEFENDKRMLEATIASLGAVEDRTVSTQASVQEDLRRQAWIAQVSHEIFLMESADLLSLVGCSQQVFAEAGCPC